MNRREFTYFAGIATLLASLPVLAKEPIKRAPALFMGHGTPMNGFNDNPFTQAWEHVGRIIEKPRAILVVSAHWETRFPAVSTHPSPPTIYDFYGFPDYMYQADYKAKGAPSLARLSAKATTHEVFEDHAQGLDHGAWILLRRLFPQADIPVFQFSLAQSLTPLEHLKIGEELGRLRDQGVMILGSGNITHNLRSARNDYRQGTRKVVHEWAQNFDDFVVEKVTNRDYRALASYQDFGRDALLSVPTPEHFLPLLYVVGSAGKENVTYFAEGFQDGSFSMRSLLFT